MTHHRADGFLTGASRAQLCEDHLVPQTLAGGKLGERADALVGVEALARHPGDVLVWRDHRREREGDLDDGRDLEIDERVGR